MTQIIVGAGMAGLLAANLLRHRDPVIYEAQGELPSNHSAVLRFRTPAVGEALGIPFRRVNVVKATLPWRNPVADAMAYSRKVLGTYRSDRSTVLPAGNSSSERWIAPPDLVEQMARRVEVVLGTPWTFSDEDLREWGKPISTIPMPLTMDLLNYPGRRPQFSYRHGANIRAVVDACDAFASVSVPDPAVPFSRASITGAELIVECPGRTREAVEALDRDDILYQAADLLGIERSAIHSPTVHDQRYAKILPIDDHERKAFIFWASSATGRTFSLGRFACWRPGLLLDDLIKDVRLIDGWIGSATPGYDMDIHHVEARR